jgi:hypothetical protein
MNDDHDDDLPADLLQRLRAWPELDDDAGIEERVLAALHSRRLLGPGSQRPSWRAWLRPLPAAALAVALLAASLAGYAAGRRVRGIPTAGGTTGARYALFLRELPDDAGNERVAEYTRWGQAQRRLGGLEMGAKLEPGVLVIGGPTAGTEVSGFFIIRARDLSEAERIARSSPHFTRGQPIEVRAIDDRR